jgi:hypothetical protein
MTVFYRWSSSLVVFLLDIGVHGDRNQRDIEKVVTNRFYWLPKQQGKWECE